MDHLQSLVAEYFESPNTSATRKKELESHLAALRKQRSNLPLYQQLLSSPKGFSSYIHWFCLSAFEELLPLWNTQVSALERREIKGFLWSLLISADCNAAFTSIVSTKLATLVVQIARQEVLSEWPSYFDDVLSFQTTNPLLCLNLLKLTVEEFVTTRPGDPLSKALQIELKSVLEHQCPRICTIATQILDHIYETEIQRTENTSSHASTPSSVLSPFTLGIDLLSPYKKDGQPAISLDAQSLGYSPSKSSPTQSLGSIISGVPRRDIHTVPMVNHVCLNRHYLVLCRISLEIIHNALAWIPLQDPMPVQSIFRSLFCYAQLTENEMCDLGALSLLCLNEIVQSKYTPSGQNEFIYMTMTRICETLQYLTGDGDSTIGGGRLAGIDDDYRSKLTDLIGNFVSQHSRRAESFDNSQFPEFLRLFYIYTFVQQSSEDFLACIHIWDKFMDVITTAIEKMDPPATAVYLLKYHGGAVGVVESLFKHRKASSSIWGSSEHKTLEKISLDVIAKVAALFPADVLQLSFDVLTTNTTAIFYGLSAQNLNSERIREYTTSIETSLFVFGRICHLFTSSFEATFSSSLALIYHFCHLEERLLGNIEAFKDFYHLSVTVLNTMTLYSHWFARLHQMSQETQEYMCSFDDLIFKTSLICVQSLNSNNPPLQLASSQMLRSISETIRPDFFKLPHIVQCLSDFHQIAFRCSPNAKDALYQFSTNIFVLPVLNTKISDPEWKTRSDMFCQFMQPLISAYLEIKQDLNANAKSSVPQVTPLIILAQQQIALSIEAFSGCLHSIQSQGTLQKEVVYAALGSTVSKSMDLLYAYGDDNEILCILLDYITLLFNALRAQNTRDNMDMYMSTTKRFMLTLKGNTLMSHLQRQSGSLVVEKAIGLLSTLIDHPYKGSASILPLIISFCVQDLYPRCIDSNSTSFDSIRPLFYGMLYQLLLNHWRYFFNVQVSLVAIKDAGDCKREEEFLAIIQGPHVDVIKQNMGLLCMLDEKCRLFSKPIFCEKMALNILDCFLSILMQKSHEFLRDDIIQFMANIVTANLALMHSRIVSLFIDKIGRTFTDEQRNGLASQIRDIKDLESCQHNIGRFIQDHAYFQSIVL
ncbi:hypothetical protein BASA61_009991 [Batrachochytrium salamandrivorans]|nr:hypothetical protein BASA61_009991 [Batrachochytrium salamandrivorans]KAH9274507.1 hypothetical protein BASA83_003140 [Batrachochytrium salamandrivorans]